MLKKFQIINSEFKNIRIDKWLKINFSLINQSYIEKNLRKGNIKVNNKKIQSKYRLQLEDEIKIYNYSDDIFLNQPSIKKKKLIPSKYDDLFNSHIIYENDNFIILDKWSGIATQGGSKINISVDDIIKGKSEKYNLVHRLDRETSGLLIIAKDLETTKYFGRLFKNHLIQKIYIAICQGNPKNTESTINILIPDKKNPDKKSNSSTKYKVIQTNNKVSNIIYNPLTGKTHQLRIVSKHLGCPIIGDTKYNNQNKYKFEKLKLNAHLLKFEFDKNTYEFTSKIPEHFIIFFKKNNLKKISSNDLKTIL